MEEFEPFDEDREDLFETDQRQGHFTDKEIKRKSTAFSPVLQK